jgi:hypothetical protein
VTIAALRGRIASAWGPATPETGQQVILITGIPRSGTSYLCSLLDGYNDCVALNEPSELVRVLAKQKDLQGLPSFVADVRRRVRAGKPIENKLLNGRVVTDTALHNLTSRYVPAVETPDFALALKNTASLLSRLDAASQALEDAVVVACVRNPYDTIASWIRSFPHLREARVGELPVANPQHPWLPDEDRIRLEEVAGTRSLPRRRALLWTHFAQIVLRSKEHALLVCYSELVRHPEAVLTKIAARRDLGSHPEPPPTCEPQRRALELAPEDVDAITDICLPVATRLGVAERD